MGENITESVRDMEYRMRGSNRHPAEVIKRK
jgi:hypothetical protein